MKKLSFFLLLFLSFQLLFSQDDINTAAECFNNAKQFAAENKFDKAIENFNKASSIYKNLDEKPNYIISELSLSELLINIGKTQEAEPKLSNIKPDAIVIFGEKSKVVAHIYSLQGRIAFMTSDNATAKIRMKKALSIKIEIFGEESIEAAMNMNDLALVYSQMGQIDSAILYYEKNISIISSVQGENSPLLSSVYINLSNLYLSLGKYAEAIEMKNKIIEIVAITGVENTPEIGEAYSGLGNAYILKGEYKIAEDFLLKSNEIFLNIYGKDNIKVASNYINLGNIYNNTANYDFALQYYYLATKIIEEYYPLNPELSGLYNNIGLVCKKQGNYQNAKIFFNKALVIKQSSDNQMSHHSAVIFSNLGSVYREQKDIPNAMLNFRKSINIFINLYGNHNPNLVNPFLNIANIYYESEEIDEALFYFQKSIIANSKYFDDENIEINPPLNEYFDGIKLLETLNGRAKLYMYLYSEDSNTVYLDKALTNIFLCDTLISQLRKSFYSQDDKIRLNREISNVFDNAVEITYMIGNENYRSNISELLFYFIERNKTSTLLQSIADAKANNFANIPDSLIEIEKNIKIRINIYTQKIAEATDEAETNFYRNKLLEENQKKQEIINIYKNTYPNYYNAKYNVSLTNPRKIQGMIDNETAVINYYLSGNYIFAFIITKKEQTIIVSDILEEDIKDVKRFNEVILSYRQSDILEYQKLAHKLYENFFFFQLPSNIKNLIIIPDEYIGTLSFEALFTEEYDGVVKDYGNYPFLIKQYSVSYSYSSTLLYETNKIDYSTLPREDIFTTAPVFKPGNSQEFNNNAISTIMGTETEVNNIIKLFENNNLSIDYLMNQNANEYQVKNILNENQYKILHIATHGFVNFENPELSALILANDSQKIEDGILYSGEIYNLSLHSDLVTLSACETARGKFSKGEGIIGLSRALIYAGTKNLIISLWKVADISTTELMTKFYKHLLDENEDLSGNLKFSSALHQAKLELIDSEYGHPFFWSSFILIGQ